MSKKSATIVTVISRKSSGKANGCMLAFSSSAKTLADLVDAYEKSQKISGKGWNPLSSLLKAYRELGNLEAAITSAALAEDLVCKSFRGEWSGKVKRHKHQRRITQIALQKGRKAIKSKIEELRACKSFDEIFGCLSENCKEIEGLGSLYIYDTALRIGAFTKNLPKRVYLQAGALAGARSLGIVVKNSPIPVNAFPAPIQRLAPHEIEDFLCIFKVDLVRIKK